MRLAFNLNKIVDKKYHKSRVREAHKVLEKLESRYGKLSKSTIKQCNDYAYSVLGSRKHAAGLYVYSHIAGEFKEGWIPDSYYSKVVVPKAKGEIGKVSEIKNLSRLLMRTDSLPDIGYFSNGLFIGKDYQVVEFEALKKDIFALSDEIVFKSDCSRQGKSVFVFGSDIQKGQIERLGNGVFQRKVKQHDSFTNFGSNALATLRMTTAINENGIASLRSCYLRLGRSDDTHIKSGTHIRVPIDVESGFYAEQAFDTNWFRINSHQDSGVEFAGNVIPSFEASKNLVVSLHQSFPFVGCIGWDIAVDDQGNVVLLEWNGAHNDIKFSEATQGPCFQDMGWVREKSLSEQL